MRKLLVGAIVAVAVTIGAWIAMHSSLTAPPEVWVDESAPRARPVGPDLWLSPGGERFKPAAQGWEDDGRGPNIWVFRTRKADEPQVFVVGCPTSAVPWANYKPTSERREIGDVAWRRYARN